MNSANRLTTITFTGDVSFSGRFANRWHDRSCVRDEVRSFLVASDHVVANVECAMTACGIVGDRALNHVSTPESASFLRDIGVDVWSLANNHIMDAGDYGLADTISVALEQGAEVVGAGPRLEEASRPLVLGKGPRVAVIAVASPWPHVRAHTDAPGAFTWDDLKLLRRKITEARGCGVDWVVVVAHGGEEYSIMPMPSTRALYHRMLEAGADIVVGHHPHVVQNYETIDGKAIFYSLGNFIFDTDNQRRFAYTDNGVLLKVHFTEEGFQFESMGVSLDRAERSVGSASEAPAFRDVSATDYGKLWPLAARAYYPLDFRKRFILSKRMPRSPKPVLLAHELALCAKPLQRDLLVGRAICSLGLWRRSGNAAMRDCLLKWERASRRDD